MVEPLLAFARSVKVAQCRILNTQDLIFLCGGRTSNQNHHGPPYQSVRDYFFQYIKANHPEIAKRLRLAEEINDWFDQGVFADLLELEEYLADLSDVIILFVESPGSIAELGAFAASDTVRPKILTVINSLHPGRSFIADGPIRRLKSAQVSLVYSFEWASEADRINDETNIETFQDLSQELSKVLLERKLMARKERKLNLKSPGHAMLFIADLIDIIGITSTREISDCLKILDNEVHSSILQKYLFLLEKLRIVKKLDYSNQVYYVTRDRGPFIRYDFVKPELSNEREKSEITDRDRAKYLTRQALKETDARRVKIYTNYLKKAPLKGETKYV
jgi:hypothetical protein